MKLRKLLTEAQCKRKEDGVSISTGQDSRMHEATAIAYKIHGQDQNAASIM